jgi:hypothetical protein
MASIIFENDIPVAVREPFDIHSLFDDNGPASKGAGAKAQAEKKDKQLLHGGTPCFG